MSVLAGQGLSYEYPGPIRAVDGVDVSVAQGEVLAVLGPNGSGKSTLLKLLAGLLPPGSGTVELDGTPVHGEALRNRARRIAVMPQSLPALPEVTVDRFVLSGRYARISRWRGAGEEDRTAVAEALHDADVGDLGDRNLTDLSGGQRQRVLVARAVAQQADVLLVDEPTTALDPEHQVGVFALIARLTCEGRAAMVVTHDLNLASQFATRLMLLDNGRVAAVGTPDEVLRPEVLAPVYGPHLHYGRMPDPDGRPYVVPWLERGGGAPG
jgi:iron complex transport system ATP-binding protein